jgi:CubicO group peptidase (beta-lactamase class C family)
MQLVSDAYAVLGAIVEHAGGKPYWRSLRERVLDRAGMTETGVSYLTPLVAQRAAGYAQNFDGYTNAPHIGVTPAGGLYSTLRDLYAFDRALYGDTLVNEQSKARLFAVRRVITAYGWKTSEDTLPNATRRRVLRTTGGLPGFEALMVRVPDARRTIILLSNVRTMVSRFDDFAIAIGRILDGRPYAMPKRSVAETLAASLTGGGSMTAIAREFDVMRADTARFALSESEINRLGYFFLSRGAPSRAADLFALTVRAFQWSHAHGCGRARANRILSTRTPLTPPLPSGTNVNTVGRAPSLAFVRNASKFTGSSGAAGSVTTAACSAPFSNVTRTVP